MTLKNIIETWKNPLRFDSNFVIQKVDIKKVLEAARWAPSAENEQVWKFLVVDNKEKKNTVVKSIEDQDSRLTSTLHDIKKLELSPAFAFSVENFNAKSDKYKDLILEAHLADVESAKTASFFIICTHVPKTFALTDMGATILNMLLVSKELGFSTRWIRNFDREGLSEELSIPSERIIDAILAFGKAVKEAEKSEYLNKNIEDFFFYNKWSNILKISEFIRDSVNLKDYNIETVDAILDRRSIRSYMEKQKVPNAVVFELIKSAMMVPLTINKPYLKIIIIDDEETIKSIAKTARLIVQQSHVQQVPLIVAIAFDCSNNSPGFYAQIDTGAIIQNMLLRAHSLGIGSCWIGAFSRKALRNVLKLEENWHLPSIAIFGYPNKYPKPTPRKDLAKIVYYNQWKSRIQKRHRTPLPNYHVMSIAFRKIKKTKVKSLLRTRKVGDLNGIPEFEQFINKKSD